MEEALERSQENSLSPNLKVSVLLDYTRGSRGGSLLLVSNLPQSLSSVLSALFVSRAGKLQDDAAAVVKALLVSDEGLAVPHSGPEGPPAAARASAF